MTEFRTSYLDFRQNWISKDRRVVYKNMLQISNTILINHESVSTIWFLMNGSADPRECFWSQINDLTCSPPPNLIRGSIIFNKLLNILANLLPTTSNRGFKLSWLQLIDLIKLSISVLRSPRVNGPLGELLQTWF